MPGDRWKFFSVCFVQAPARDLTDGVVAVAATLGASADVLQPPIVPDRHGVRRGRAGTVRKPPTCGSAGAHMEWSLPTSVRIAESLEKGGGA